VVRGRVQRRRSDRTGRVVASQTIGRALAMRIQIVLASAQGESIRQLGAAPEHLGAYGLPLARPVRPEFISVLYHAAEI
jgi:hypothetical protein